MGDVTKIKLGDDICSRFDVEQEAINSNNHEYIRCIQSSSQEAGRYNVTEQVTPGYANHSRYMRRSSFDAAEYFEFTSLPTVAMVNPATGNIGGQYLTIAGTGFSNNPLNNSVSVDGNDCAVTSSQNDQIKCTLAPQNASLSSLLSTNSSSQQSGYFSGAGLKYARYARNAAMTSLTAFITAVRAADTTTLGTAKEQGFRADLREANVHTENEAQTWSGYFTAPTTGTYTFRGTADDKFAFYLATTYGSNELPATPLLETSNYQYWFYPFLTNPSGSEATVDLEAGKSYYMEAFHFNYDSVGFFNLAVEVPNMDNTTSFQTYQIDNVTTTSTVQEEVVVYSMIGENLVGDIQLEVYRQDPSTFEVTYEKKVNVTYGCSDLTFKSTLQQFDGFKNYEISVVRTIYDASNATLSNTAGAARIDYTVSFYLLRSSSLSAEAFRTQFFGGYTGTFESASIQSHSPLISGNFTLTIGGVAIVDSNNDVNIPHDIQSWTLQERIRGTSIVGF